MTQFLHSYMRIGHLYSICTFSSSAKAIIFQSHLKQSTANNSCSKNNLLVKHSYEENGKLRSLI